MKDRNEKQPNFSALIHADLCVMSTHHLTEESVLD